MKASMRLMSMPGRASAAAYWRSTGPVDQRKEREFVARSGRSPTGSADASSAVRSCEARASGRSSPRLGDIESIVGVAGDDIGEAGPQTQPLDRRRIRRWRLSGLIAIAECGGWRSGGVSAPARWLSGAVKATGQTAMRMRSRRLRPWSPTRRRNRKPHRSAREQSDRIQYEEDDGEAEDPSGFRSCRMTGDVIFASCASFRMGRGIENGDRSRSAAAIGVKRQQRRPSACP